MIDACSALSAEQLQTTVPGTYGSIIDTLRHLVAGDTSYLSVTTGGRVARIDADTWDLPALRHQVEGNAAAWLELVGGELDPDLVLTRHRDDGSVLHAPLGIRLAQALHHGTDHRSQVCTALTSLGIEPPEIDAWSFGLVDGSVIEIPPPA